MADEQKTDAEIEAGIQAALADKDLATPEEDITEPPEPTPEEAKARSKGWKPQEEYEGDGWVDAGEFLRRSELYDSLHKANRKIRRLEDQLKTLADWHAKTEENTWKQAVAEVSRQLKHARQEQDWDAVEDLEAKKEELQGLKPEQKEDAAGPQGEGPTEENLATFAQWRMDNPWYDNDEAKKEFAIGIAYAVEKQNPDMGFEEVLSEVSKKVDQHFALQAKPPKRTAAPVAGARAKPAAAAPSKKSLPTYRQLPDEAREVYNQLVKSDRNPGGFMDHDTWMKEYVANNGPLVEE